MPARRTKPTRAHPEITTRGDRIRALRDRRGWTLFDLAVKSGFRNPANLSRVECGYKEVSVPTLVRLADALGCSTDYLTGRADKP